MYDYGRSIGSCVVGYDDYDHASNLDKRRYQTSSVFTLPGRVISSKVTLQSMVGYKESGVYGSRRHCEESYIAMGISEWPEHVAEHPCRTLESKC